MIDKITERVENIKYDKPLDVWQKFKNSNITEVLLIDYEKYLQIERIFFYYSQVICRKTSHKFLYT